ncbi:unnamed protein product [Gordionus sp. m RMFG-2023]
MRLKLFLPILFVHLIAFMAYLTVKQNYMLSEDWKLVTKINLSRMRSIIEEKANLSDRYEFLDENSNTTQHERFHLLDIPRAFFVHKPRELCSDMGWSYDFSSYHRGKSHFDMINYTVGRPEKVDEETHSSYQAYLKFVNEGGGEKERDNLFQNKEDIPKKQMSLIIGIFTRPKEFGIRLNARKIWASPFSAHLKSSLSNDATYTGSYLNFIDSRNETVVCKIKTVFVLGLFEPGKDDFPGNSVNTSRQELEMWNNNIDRERRLVQKAIDAESRIHGDIVQATFEESYANLSYKTGALFKWASTHCDEAQLLLKLDLDVYARLDILMTLLEDMTSPIIESEANSTNEGLVRGEKHVNANQNTENGTATLKFDDLMEFQKNIYGNVAIALSVARDPSNKNAVSKEDYEPDKYPPFCYGWGYIMSPRLAGIIYRTSVECCARPFHNEDAYWTGIIPDKRLAVGYKELNSYYKYDDYDWGKRPYVFSSYENLKTLRKLYFRNSHF